MKNTRAEGLAIPGKTDTSRLWHHADRMVEIISALLILLFVYTSASKFLDFDSFKRTLHATPLIRDNNILVAWTLPIVELAISLLLYFRKTRLKGLYASFILMSIFTIYLAYMILFTPDRPCNCGGVIKDMSWNQHVIFNLFFTALAWTGTRLYKKIGR